MLEAVLLVLAAPVALAAAVAGGLLAATARSAGVSLLLFALGSVAIGWWPLPAAMVTALPPATLLLLGTALAWSPGWMRRSAGAFCLLSGIAAGLAGGARTSTLPEAIAAGLALSCVALGAMLLRQRVPLPLAAAALLPRVAGAWIAAIGALLLALALRHSGA